MPSAICLRACLLGLLTTALSLHPHSARAGAPQNSWKAGTASVVITPEQPMWMAGYSNDVFGYLPSLRVLNEGGYEAGGAMRYTKLPGPFAPSVETLVIDKVHELAKRTQAAVAE